MNIKLIVSKKINVSFIVNFCLGEHSFSIDTFGIYHVYIVNVKVFKSQG